ncbi:glucosaminidase domain-containing protein [Paraeggerthella sp.]|uniref:glucosaminidase domain-containing protein n=1 Tax=Paraeggerthella sp. TaxID=2897350 RepID=UPI003AB40BB1
MNRPLHPVSKKSQLVSIAIALALLWQLGLSAFTTPQAAFGTQAPAQDITRIHILPFPYTDAIVLESNGRFGIVDSGEDNDYPDGTDVRYPLRPGVTRGEGVENSVISYLKSLGVNSGNLEFYLGTHPHSDHIGSADEVIREFNPRRVYIPEYQDSFISDETRLWDNQYVYDRAIAAAKETGAVLIQNLNPSAPIEPSSNESGEEKGTLSTIGSTPEADVLDAAAIIERFGIDPTDQRDPYNSETLPETGISVTRPNDSNLIHEHEPNPSTTGNPCFALGDMNIEIVNYGDDYKFNPVPDANYFSWGVKVQAYESTAFLSGDINNYDGDEDRLAGAIGHVDLLKLAHHGSVGSNTPRYVAALSPTYAVQTGYGANLPEYVTSTLDALRIRYFPAPEASASGLEAVIATFTQNGIKLNTMQDGTTFHSFNHSPYMAAYHQGLKQKQQGWRDVDDSWYWFDNSAAASESTWLKRNGAWYWLTESGRMATGWAKTPDGTWYYFDGSGAMRSGGWLKDGASWYYLSASGAMQTGWLKQGGAWYWLDPESGRMATGWAKDSSGTWYYFEGSGAMRAGGWMSSGGAWYYLAASGAMQTGWLDLGDKRYYLNESGVMATGAVTIDGKTYRFDASGALLPSDSVMGPSSATVQQMVAYYSAQGVAYPSYKYATRGAPTISDFCQVLLDQAKAENVRAEVLFAQAMLETGWLQFGGDVDKGGRIQCNFGGIGATGNGVPGDSFPDVKTGLLAQAQHLKGYASTDPLNQPCVDPRFKYLTDKRGSAPTVDKLSGTWAADKTYGAKIMDSLGRLLSY